MVISAVTGGVAKVLQVYDKQRFYAERAAQIKMPKTVQIGVEDRLTISPDAAAKMASSTVAPTILQKSRAIYYDDPRIKARRAQQADKADKSAEADGFVEGFVDLVKVEQTKSAT